MSSFPPNTTPNQLMQSREGHLELFRRLNGRGFNSLGFQTQNFQGFDEAFFPTGFFGPPHQNIAPFLQHEANREAGLARRARFQDAINSMQQGFSLLQSFRPGAAPALASGLLQNQAQLIAADAADIQAPDLMFSFRQDQMIAQRARDSRSARRARLGSIIGAVGAGVATIATGGATAPLFLAAAANVAATAMGGQPSQMPAGAGGGGGEGGGGPAAPEGTVPGPFGAPSSPEGVQNAIQLSDPGAGQQGPTPGVNPDMLPGAGAQNLAQAGGGPLQQPLASTIQPPTQPPAGAPGRPEGAGPQQGAQSPSSSPELTAAGQPGAEQAVTNPPTPAGQAAHSFAARGPLGAPIASLLAQDMLEESEGFFAALNARLDQLFLEMVA